MFKKLIYKQHAMQNHNDRMDLMCRWATNLNNTGIIL